MSKPSVILPFVQRSGMDCGLCCLQMLSEQPYSIVRDKALEVVPTLHDDGMSIREILKTARLLGLNLKCRPRPLELNDDDVGLLFLKIKRGYHYVVWFEGVLINPADGQVWNPGVYLESKGAKVKSAYALAEDK